MRSDKVLKVESICRTCGCILSIQEEDLGYCGLHVSKSEEPDYLYFDVTFSAVLARDGAGHLQLQEINLRGAESDGLRQIWGSFTSEYALLERLQLYCGLDPEQARNLINETRGGHRPQMGLCLTEIEFERFGLSYIE